jgi:hypothetical protein
MTISERERKDLIVAIHLTLKVIVNSDPFGMNEKQREEYAGRLIQIRERLELEKIEPIEPQWN